MALVELTMIASSALDFSQHFAAHAASAAADQARRARRHADPRPHGELQPRSDGTPRPRRRREHLHLLGERWFAIIAGIIGLIACAIMMMIGRRNRSNLAVEGATGTLWIVGGLIVVGIAAGLVTGFVN